MQKLAFTALQVYLYQCFQPFFTVSCFYREKNWFQSILIVIRFFNSIPRFSAWNQSVANLSINEELLWSPWREFSVPDSYSKPFITKTDTCLNPTKDTPMKMCTSGCWTYIEKEQECHFRFEIIRKQYRFFDF